MTERFDIVVIGGGIHGVGVAQAAACAGYSVMLLEKTTLAHGTSSRSSKLIHGGLRYLSHQAYGLVRESLRERALLLRLAPDLVRLIPFHIPVYPQTTHRPLHLRAGLSLYALLGGLHRENLFSLLPKRAWGDLDGLETDRLQAVFRYYDAQTDDAALTRAVMHSAIAYGADLRYPATFTTARIHAQGCHIAYRMADTEHECSASVLVNAAGPWADKVDSCITPRPTPVAIDLVQGAHLVLPDPARHGGYYLEAPQDRRAVFLLPWREGSLIGTTEYVFAGDPQEVKVLDQEKAYLLAVLQHYFPRRSTRVVECFAGLRVLPTSADAPFRRSRETRLPVDDPTRPRLLSIYGGKLTGYRATAEKVVRRLSPTLPSRRPRARTDQVPLAAN